MRRVQIYTMYGKTVRRVYEGHIGRPKGIRSSTYNLSEEGLQAKRKGLQKMKAILHKEGRVSSRYWGSHKMTAEHRAKNSKGVKRAIANGKLDPAANIRKFIADGAGKNYLETRVHHGTHGRYYSAKNKKHLRYDSSWELQRMYCLESDDTVVEYRKNPVRIPYSLNGKAHYYWPDFLVGYKNGDHILEEIKPRGWAKEPIVQAKFRAARLFCKSAGLQFRVLTEIHELDT